MLTGWTIAQVTADAGPVDAETASEGVTSLLKEVRLCSIATSDSHGPWICNTFYVVLTAPLRLIVLTGPTTRHGAALQADARAAVGVASTTQTWTDSKRGLQLECSAALTPTDEIPAALEAYLAEYPGLRKWVNAPEDIESIDSRLFTLTPNHIQLFDEPRFGAEVWVDLRYRV